MALPAGRYGVTKNQLLKIKKLPMNTIKLIEEIQEELDTFGTAVTHDATSVVTQSTDLVESGAVYDALLEKADNSVIGTVEDGATCANPNGYKVGQHFIREGAFKTVTSPIAEGESLVGSNKFTSGTVANSFESVDVTSEFTFESNISASVNASWTHIYKQGNRIEGFLRFKTPSTATQDEAIITVPSKYACKTTGVFIGVINSVWNGTAIGCIGFSANDNTKIKLLSDVWTTGTNVVAHFSYPI